MSNPAPTLNQINAFNVTQGTTIDFNIIGGTEVIRSNKIYIYDLSDNSLICTHLYPSTESIHELPANDDASMMYASGKSSADFVNNKQYYAQIQTFTNTGGTEGGSGVSVAKLFWCLPNPSLAFDPIDPQIATTTYNATATYDSNITDENVTVPNIVQQYQFDLYTGAGALVESSGVIVGNGTQIGATTQWTLTYNFSNLVVGSSYYFKVNVLTTEGMELSAQSGTFTVDIATPTMDKATVSNDACNGYISVTSNLSSEYEHSASGDDILTFETESVNDVSSLKVDLNPQQDGTPWIASSDETAPYLLRQSGGGNVDHSFNRENDTLVGGSFAWNQSVEDDVAYHEASGAIASFDDGVVGNLTKCLVDIDPIQDLHGYDSPWVGGGGKNKANDNASAYSRVADYWTCPINLEQGKTYTIKVSAIGSTPTGFAVAYVKSGNRYDNFEGFSVCLTLAGDIFPKTFTVDASFTDPKIAIYIPNPQTTEHLAEFFSTVAHVQLEEGSTATTWTPYSNICPISGRSSVGVTDCGKNLFDKSTVVFGERFNAGGTTSVTNTLARSALIRIKPSTAYYFTNVVSAQTYSCVWWYDKDGNNVGYNSIAGGIGEAVSGTFTSPATAYYVGVNLYGTHIDDAMVHEGSSASAYEQYNGTTTTIPLGQTVYGAVVDCVSGDGSDELGVALIQNLSWTRNASEYGYAYFYAGLSDRKNGVVEMMCEALKYVSGGRANLSSDCTFTYYSSSGTEDRIAVRCDQCTSSSELTTLLNNIKIVYPLATAEAFSTTPTQISILKGQNNIFSDGEIDVTYPTNHSYQSLNTTHKYYTKLNGTETISIGSNIVANVGTDMVVDLTLMFGSTIADYVYGLEQATSGSGVAWLKGYGFLTNSRYGYNSGELVSVNTSEHKMVGFNQWDEEWESGDINIVNGNKRTDSSRIRSKNFIPVIPNATYYCKSPYLNTIACFYDFNKNWVSSSEHIGYEVMTNRTVTIPSWCGYMMFYCTSTTYKNDICINISKTTGSPKNGDYVPYTYHTYPLADIQLRGIPQLNANNKLTYNGDEYYADGGVSRNYGIVDLGTLSWTKIGSGSVFWAAPSNRPTNRHWNGIVSKYVEMNSSYAALDNMCWTNGSGSREIYVRDDAYTDATTFKSAMSGVYLIYEKATSTSEQTTPFESPQQVDQYGTEEYVDTRSVPIPVGHKTRYSDEYPVYGWDEVEVFARGVNWWDEETRLGTYDGTTGAYNSSYTDRLCNKNTIKVKPNTEYYFKFKSGTTGGNVYFYDASGTYISMMTNRGNLAFTTSNDCHFINVSFGSAYGTTYNHDISINYPSTDTSYHAYQGATYTKTLPDYDQLLAQNKVPYVTKRVGSDYADVLSEDIVGGTVAFNQLIEHGNFDATTGWSTAGYGNMAVSNNVGTVTLTDAGTSGRIERSISPNVGHKVLCVANIKPSFSTNLFISLAGTGVGAFMARVVGATADSWNQISGIRNVVDSDLSSGVIRFYFGGVAGSVGATVQFKDIVLFDLTQMFGSTIADYIYNLEQTTQGAGVQWFKSLFPDDYYPYNAGELKSVNVGAHNILDEHMNVVESYPLDSSLTLRGIPKLDANNKLYYDGDVYSASGSVERKYGIVVLDGTSGQFQEVSQATTADGTKYVAYINRVLLGSKDSGLAIVSKEYEWKDLPINNLHVGQFDTRGSYVRFVINDQTITTLSAWETHLSNNPITLVYELATPTTETATPFESRQSITPYGYEQYCVTSNNELVPTFVPVGHDTKYYATKIFGGEVDLVSGVVKIDRVSVDLGSLTWVTLSWGKRSANLQGVAKTPSSNAQVANLLAEKYATQSYESSASNGISLSVDGYLAIITTDAPTGQLVYELATPIYIHMSPEQIQTLVGENNMWTNGDSLSLDYNIPVTALLVKRQDTSNPSGTWLTLYMKPVTQADDMDFTYIDFLNQYGKTYKYALVPLLRQKQGDVDVEIEGGYTLSNAVDSVFDGVFIADADMSQRVKAGASYGNVATNQSVGTLTPIGAQYPVVITNSHNRYDSGSISGYIVPSDFYSTGNLSRTDIVKKYNEIKQFLTNKKPKVIKDWNGNIWLTMILDNIDCTFDNNYGMGMITFSANWVQVGDATNQEDLQSTGLVNVGGV